MNTWTESAAHQLRRWMGALTLGALGLLSA